MRSTTSPLIPFKSQALLKKLRFSRYKHKITHKNYIGACTGLPKSRVVKQGQFAPLLNVNLSKFA